MKSKPLDIVLLIFKILIPLIMIVQFVWLVYLRVLDRIEFLEMIKIHGEPPMNYGMAEFLSVLFIAFVNFCCFIITGICLIIANCFKSSQKRDRHIKHFGLMIFAPMVSTVLFCIIIFLILIIG